MTRPEKTRSGLAKVAVSAIILLTIVSSLFSAAAVSNASPTSAKPRLPVQASPSAQNVTTVSINPSSIAGQQYTSGPVTFGVYINKTSGTFNTLTSFQVIFSYNTAVLNAVSIDYSTGIFAAGPFVFYECINNIGVNGNTCKQVAGAPGSFTNEVTLSLLQLTSPVTVTSGLLFTVDFQIVGTGFSNIHIEEADVSTQVSPTSALTNTVTTVPVDGYFTNSLCGPALCRPLAVTLNYTAVPAPVIGRPIRFNATVADPNSKANVTLYHWLWGDTSVGAPTDLFTTTHYANHTYENNLPYFVTLIVNDTYGVTGYATQLIVIGRVWIQLSIGSFVVRPQSLVTPGTSVNVTVTAKNLGTTNQTASLSVVLGLGIHGNQTLIDQTCPLLMPNGACSSTKILDTSNLSPNVYRLVASAQLLSSNSTFFMNDTKASSQSAFIWLVQPYAASLSIAQAAGIGVGVLVVAYAAFFVIGRFVRRERDQYT